MRFATRLGRHGGLPPLDWSHGLQLTAQLLWRGLVPVTLTVAPIGAVIAIEGLDIFRIFGLERLLSALLGVAMVREFSPALASVMIAAQAGSSIAARIGTMNIRQQIDALEVMSVDPVRHLVAPGVLACIVATPLLTIITNALGLMSGWLFAVPLGGIDHGAFMSHWTLQVTLTDLWLGLLKAAIFGATVGLAAGYFGLHTTGGATAVGLAANRTVVTTIVAILIIDYAISFACLNLSM